MQATFSPHTVRSSFAAPGARRAAALQPQLRMRAQAHRDELALRMSAPRGARRGTGFACKAMDLPELGEVTDEDREYMKMCLDLARTAEGKTDPNPMVGAVIVKDGNIVGMGFHPKAGQPHAEVFALRAAGERADGATAYVSLEPCNHFGRTPPCSQALVGAKISRVVVGMVDPDPRVSGGGLWTCKNAGLEVCAIGGELEEECKSLNKGFIERVLAAKAEEEAKAGSS